jgi:pyocin large subunit-like protein
MPSINFDLINDVLDKLKFLMAQPDVARIHPGRCIRFHRRKAKIAGTTPRRLHDTNATPHGLQHTPNNRTMKTLLAPTPATNGGEEIHQAPKPHHDRRRKLREPTLKDGTTNATAHP